jgi:hypothetical protein
MGLTDFRYIITAQDRFSTTFRKFDQGVQSSARGLDKLSGVISGGGLGMLFGATAGVAGAIGIAKATWALGELGAQSITTRNSFETLMRSVGQSPALLDQMKAAAGGTITEMKLMQAANTALAGTSGALASELAGAIPQLIEAGRAAAMLNPSMGDAAFMTQSLITGIKRGSPMLIDNTGITLKLGEATDAYADSVGKSVEELTSQENSIAILRATLAGADTLIRQTGGSMDSMVSDMQRAKTAVEELKTAIGEMMAPSVADIATGGADFATRLADLASSDELTKLNTQLAILREHQQTGSILAKLFPKETAADIARIQRQIGELNHTNLETSRSAQTYATAVEEASGATVTFDDRLVRLIATARTGGAAMQALSAYINSVQAAASFTGRYTGFLGGVDVLSQTQYVALTRNRIDLERALNVQVAAGILQQQQADYQLQVFDNRVSDHISSLRNQTQAVGNVATSYDDLRDRISGAMRPTFDLSSLTGGLLGGQMGNGFDEAYKRLAAVALRPEELQIHAGDWASTFEQAGLTGLTPEDAQARARELVEAYSKGLDFSLIDREAIKDSVRQAIRADELYNSIVDEIYREMGRPNPKAGAAGYALGRQIGAATTQALKDMAPDAIGAMAGAIAPSVARILGQQAARYEQ